MAGGNIIDEVKQIDSDGNIAKIDALTGATYTLAAEHGLIHEGRGFFLSHKTVVAANSTYDILFSISSNYVHLMSHTVITTTSPGELCLFESATVSASGTPLTLLNSYRESSITSNSLAFSEPTVSSVGNLIDCDFITGGRFEGGISTAVSAEWVLKLNTNYLFRYSNASASAADANFSIFYLEV